MEKGRRNYILEVSPAAQRDLKKLPDKVVREVVFVHLPHIQKDPFAHTKPLVGGLRGEWSFSFGRKPEYRIIFYVQENLITVTIIGSRENIYKEAKRRK